MTQTSPVTELILWEGSVRTHTFADQVKAAQAGGFSGLALTPSAYFAAARQTSGGLSAVREVARSAGLTLHLDTATGWAPIRVPSGADAELIERFDHSLETCIELTTALGLRSILAVAVFDHDAVPLPDLVRGFGELCDVASPLGVQVNLEFMPFWGVPDLAAALAIVEAADRPNGGLMLDTWHFAHSGRDLGLLKAVAGWPVHLQLADGVQAPAGADLIEATLHTRELPGEGDLDIAEVVDIVLARNIPFTAGPEVFSDRLDESPAVDAGAALGKSTRTVLGL